MWLLVIKVAVSIIMVVLLAEVSKRVSPLLGGILSGLPLGVGLAVYFISYSDGIKFVITGIPWGIAGLAAGVLFCLFYLLGGKLLNTTIRLISIVFCICLGFIVFFASGYLIQKLSLSLLSALCIFFSVFLANIFIVKKIKVEGEAPNIKRGASSFVTILIRGLIVGGIIIAITGSASIVGSKWAGVLSSFPSILFSLLLVLHFEEGNKLYPAVIRGFSLSVSTLALFYVLCWYLLPLFGLNLGFIITYVLCCLFLIAIKVIPEKLSNIKP